MTPTTDKHEKPKCRANKNKLHSDSCKNCVGKEFGHSYGLVCKLDDEWIYPK
ncbi:hypothetical protein LCGC14_1315910 [marine sediment metagenome]|uniref:Uncharacterized protein n=1 Tax=marine sediment metagenome TaxID=412755 RepID=A0A0F9KLI6_9ZZZZ